MKYALLLLAVLAGCSSVESRRVSPVSESHRTYPLHVSAFPAGITLDGVDNEAVWKNAEILDDFSFPWREVVAPRTEFSAFCDPDNLYFYFDVEDEDIVILGGDDEGVVADEDRVELFITATRDLNAYFCAEMDFRGRVLDYRASFYRNFDRSWDFPGLRLAGRRTSNGYAVEGSIPLATFETLGLPAPQSGRLRVGVYRAEFSHGADSSTIQHWIAWVNPRTSTPDFHVPSSFGLFK